MKLIHKTIRDGQDGSHLFFCESRDPETDKIPEVLITFGYGDEHSHSSLSLKECEEVIEFLQAMLKKHKKYGE